MCLAYLSRFEGQILRHTKTFHTLKKMNGYIIRLIPDLQNLIIW